MLKRICATLLFLGFCTIASAQVERPKLVVGLMVDQMRWDYLYRFADRYYRTQLGVHRFRTFHSWHRW